MDTKVVLTRGDERVFGVLYTSHGDEYIKVRFGDRVTSGGLTLGWWEENGFTVNDYIPPYVEPTEPGLYQDQTGDLWLLSGQGGWELLTYGGRHVQRAAPGKTRKHFHDLHGQYRFTKVERPSQTGTP